MFVLTCAVFNIDHFSALKWVCILWLSKFPPLPVVSPPNPLPSFIVSAWALSVWPCPTQLEGVTPTQFQCTLLQGYTYFGSHLISLILRMPPCRGEDIHSFTGAVMCLARACSCEYSTGCDREGGICLLSEVKQGRVIRVL